MCVCAVLQGHCPDGGVPEESFGQHESGVLISGGGQNVST